MCSDGTTYSNACEAEGHGVTVTTEGICDVRPCPSLFVPVCGSDELTYSNAVRQNAVVFASSTPAYVRHRAAIVRATIQPVCGVDSVYL